MRLVVALGGNALSPAGGTGSVEEMRSSLSVAASALASLVTDGHSYLEAYCHLAGAIRHFRVDRIEEIRRHRVVIAKTIDRS